MLSKNNKKGCRSVRSGIVFSLLLIVLLLMSNAASAANETILVATNRYVILDDPAAGTASTNFVNPNSADYTSNIWDGKQTTLGVKTLFIDSNGTPLTGRTVNFTIYRPGGTYATGTNVTDPNGVSSFYRDLNGANFWGNWTVRAESGGVSQNTTFIYNWWGCAWSSGGCQGQHSGKTRTAAGTQATANSPYTYSSERVTGLRTSHNLDISVNGWAEDYCTVCHQNYDGNPTTSNAGGGPAKDFTPPDTHRNIRCDNSSCHNPNGTSAWDNHNTGGITIGSCNNCHNRTDITKKSTLNGVVSNYSNASSGTIDKYHTPNATVPCIICHGPMHNITKPNETQRFIRNTITEDSHCTTCHKAKNTTAHTTGSSCTTCHSEDVHVISSGASPNCIQCHNLVTGLSGGAPAGINFTAANQSVHYGINSQNATNRGYAPVVGACWACHDTDGNVSTGHPDRLKTPKECDECHLSSGAYYSQSQNWGLNVTVSEHYYNGAQIAAGNSNSNISSCINCHENVSEMIIYNNDTDTGSFSGDGVRLTGGNKSFYHYGKDRSNLRTGSTANCAYCHRNTQYLRRDVKKLIQ